MKLLKLKIQMTFQNHNGNAMENETEEAQNGK